VDTHILRKQKEEEDVIQEGYVLCGGVYGGSQESVGERQASVKNDNPIAKK
jgi:hypothetical protein